jgi:hypothetical protein
MNEPFCIIEIGITDFVEDPPDDTAFGINFQINGPGTKVEYPRVSFTDQFIEDYFKVRWPKDLAQETRKLHHMRRSLFIKWAVFRIELWLQGGRPEQNIVIDTGDAIKWAKRIGAGTLAPASEMKEKRLYHYKAEIKDGD